MWWRTRLALSEALEASEAQREQLLKTIAELNARPTDIQYIVQTNTVLVPSEPVFITRDPPAIYRHVLQEELVVGEFRFTEGQYEFETFEFVLRGSLAISDEESALYVEGSTSADPDHWETIPVDITVQEVGITHKVLEPRLGLAATALVPDFTFHPSLVFSYIHPTPNLDALQLRVGSDFNTASIGLAP